MRTLAALSFVMACSAACGHGPRNPPPAPAAGSGAPIERVVRPEIADPAADRWLQDQYAVFDRGAPAASRLVAYLVGANSKPAAARSTVGVLAAMGFHVVAPMYANDYGITGVCAPGREPDDDCHRRVRLEAFEGADHSPHVAVSRANSAEERVTRMLAHLAAKYPDDGWGGFLDETGRPRWAEMVVAGHSHGASSAGLVGKIRRVARVVMLSGPFDNRSGAPAPWTRLVPQTPLDRFWGFSHVSEEQHQGHLADWDAMGLLGPPANVDHAAPPFAGSHQLVTALDPPPGKNPHGVTAAGLASPRLPDGSFRLAPVWRHLFGR